MVSEKEGNFSEAEAALYDRQIRLWGVDAQKRLNNSKILIIGLTGLGAEVSKNIILGGVKSVTFMDHKDVEELDFASQFFLPRDSVGKNRAEASLPRAKALNPMVDVVAENCKPDDKPDEYFTNFTVICAIGCEKFQILRLNRVARLHGVKFFASDVFGFSSYIFLDLGEHPYKKEDKVVNLGGKDAADRNTDVKIVDRVCFFVPFQDILNIDWTLEEFSRRVKRMNPGIFALFVLLEFMDQEKRHPLPSSREQDFNKLLQIRDAWIERNGVPKEKLEDALFENVYGELSPVAASSGGVLAQEIVKAISHKDEPIQDLFIYNPLAGTGYVENFAS